MIYFSNALPSMNVFRPERTLNEDKILDFINKRTDQNVVKVKSLADSLFQMLFILLVFGGLLFIVIKYRHIISYPFTWLTVALIVYLLCCGGIVHNILHGSHFVGTRRSKTGEIEYEFIAKRVISTFIIAQKSIHT